MNWSICSVSKSRGRRFCRSSDKSIGLVRAQSGRLRFCFPPTSPNLVQPRDRVKARRTYGCTFRRYHRHGRRKNPNCNRFAGVHLKRRCDFPVIRQAWHSLLARRRELRQITNESAARWADRRNYEVRTLAVHRSLDRSRSRLSPVRP
jgi:hypothetical protein